MRKRNIPLICGILLSFCLLTTSCNRVDADAKKAAKLTNRSVEQTTKLQLEKAEKSYKEAREIIRKYNDHKKSEEFAERYRKYRDEGKTAHKEEP